MMSSNETSQYWAVNGNIMVNSDDTSSCVESPKSNYAAMAKLAVGSDATLVLFAGTESVKDLPGVRPVPNLWMANMMP